MVKSMGFAPRGARIERCLRESFREYDLASRIFGRGASVEANARESSRGHNRADIRSNAAIASRGAGESSRWLGPLRQVGYMPRQDKTSTNNDSAGARKVSTPIVKSISTANDKNIKTEPLS